MNAKEIEGIITRIVKDFSHLMPGLSVQFMKTKAYRARVAGRTAQLLEVAAQPAPAQGGFPEDLEPSVVLPVPLMPEPALPAP